MIGALALTPALMAVACGGGADPTSTPASTPTPTPTPLSPLSVSDSSSIGDVLSQLPASEQQCVQDALGDEAYNQVLQLGSEDDISSEHEDVVAGCLSDESLSRIVIGGLINEFGSLSDATVDCMKGTLADADLASLALGAGDDIENGAAIGLTLLLCLNDEEATQADIAFFGDSDISVAQLRCITESVDVSVLLELDQGQDQIPPVEVLQAMLDCNVEIPTGDGPDLTPGQLQCLIDALGPGFLQRGDDDTPPTAAELEALTNCGVEIPTGDDGHDFTSDQLQCLLNAVGPDFLQRGDTGEPSTPAELQALIDCGVDIPTGDDGDGPQLTPDQLSWVLDAVGATALQEFSSGDRHPTADELTALEACGVDIPTGDIPTSRSNDSSREHVDDGQKACLDGAPTPWRRSRQETAASPTTSRRPSRRAAWTYPPAMRVITPATTAHRTSMTTIQGSATSPTRSSCASKTPWRTMPWGRLSRGLGLPLLPRSRPSWPAAWISLAERSHPPRCAKSKERDKEATMSYVESESVEAGLRFKSPSGILVETTGTSLHIETTGDYVHEVVIVDGPGTGDKYHLNLDAATPA